LEHERTRDSKGKRNRRIGQVNFTAICFVAAVFFWLIKDKNETEPFLCSVESSGKKEAATLGRTTDLRIIAETAIPRSTTELQQLMKHNSAYSQ
jgi:hypothetical protein